MLATDLIDDSKWIRQRPLPMELGNQRCFIVSALSPDTLILIDYTDNATNGIYKFQIMQNQWQKVMGSGKDFDFDTTDKSGDCIPMLCIFGQNDTYKVHLNSNSKAIIPKLNARCNPRAFISIKGKLHMISSSENWTYYLSFDEITREFVLLYSWNFQLMQLLYLKKRQSMLLITRNCVPEYYRKETADMYEFSLVSQEWRSISAYTPKHFATAVPIINGEYVAFLGIGWISIFDFEINACRESAIRTPIDAVFDAVCVDGCSHRILTAGFIRECFGSYMFKNIHPLPQCLLNIIANFVGSAEGDEMIHIIEKNGPLHWKIKVNDIIGTLLINDRRKRCCVL